MVNHLSKSRLIGFSLLILALAFLTIEVTTAQSFIATADLRFEDFLVSIRNPFLLGMFTWITMLGNGTVVLAITALAAAALLYFKASKSYVAGLIVSIGGAYAADYVMKALIERARPGGLIPSTIESFFSFPSGHATAAMALYGFLAFLVCRLNPKYAVGSIAVAAVLILATGFSRLYLGVHYPSDVIGGYALGALWLFIGIEIAEQFSPIRK